MILYHITKYSWYIDFHVLMAICASSFQNVYSNPLAILILGVCFVIVELYKFCIYSWYSSIIGYMTCEYFLTFCGLSFHSLDSILWCTKPFKLWWSPACQYFPSLSLVLISHSWKFHLSFNLWVLGIFLGIFFLSAHWSWDQDHCKFLHKL